MGNLGYGRRRHRVREAARCWHGALAGSLSISFRFCILIRAQSANSWGFGPVEAEKRKLTAALVGEVAGRRDARRGVTQRRERNAGSSARGNGSHGGILG